MSSKTSSLIKRETDYSSILFHSNLGGLLLTHYLRLSENITRLISLYYFQVLIKIMANACAVPNPVRIEINLRFSCEKAQYTLIAWNTLKGSFSLSLRIWFHHTAILEYKSAPDMFFILAIDHLFI